MRMKFSVHTPIDSGLRRRQYDVVLDEVVFSRKRHEVRVAIKPLSAM